MRVSGGQKSQMRADGGVISYTISPHDDVKRTPKFNPKAIQFTLKWKQTSFAATQKRVKVKQQARK